MKGFIEVYDQRTQFLKDIFLSHGYQIDDKQSQNLDFYVVKNQKIDHDHTFSLNNINTKYIINKDKVFKHLNNTLTAMGLYLKIIQDKIHYNNILILGYGDLAKQLANILKNNYDITICNRNYKDIDEIKKLYHHMDINTISGTYDLIINTIPICKIDYEKLKYKQIYDLAQTIQCEHYQSLRNVPMLYFPYESALLMFQYIHGVMKHV
nr:hypothetical protein [uncultured Faecalibacillus sp.]